MRCVFEFSSRIVHELLAVQHSEMRDAFCVLKCARMPFAVPATSRVDGAPHSTTVAHVAAAPVLARLLAL